MTDDYVSIIFSQAERTAQALVQEAGTLDETRQYLSRTGDNLLWAGFEGAFRADFETRCTALLRQVQTLRDEVDESGRDLATAAYRLYEVDQECAALLQTSGTLERRFQFILDDQGRIIGISPTSGYSPYPPYMIWGREQELFTSYQNGLITWDQLTSYLSGGSLTLFDGPLFDVGGAYWSGQTALGQYGMLNASLLSWNAGADGSLVLGQDGLVGNVNFQGAAYLAQFNANAQYGGLSAAANGFLGAEMTGKGDLMINPFTGTAYASASAEAFAGVKVQGQAAADFGALDAGAKGSFYAGIGANAAGELGFQEGVFKMNFEVGAALGIGGEIGGSIELDVDEAVSDIVNGASGMVSGVGGVASDLGGIVGGWL
ncbi:MAG TPA: hypothetical protein VHP83_01520 [Aggregatilineaceae bacterium]|nr:hypothetical protein [Aggregatilineaceae bacterium]